jgi:hypothetical protein
MSSLFLYVPNLYFMGMKSWREYITPELEWLEKDRVRIVLRVEDQELGTLYFEKAKKGWNTKPIQQNGYACVEAKVEGLYVYGGDSITPKEIVAWCQELIRNVNLIEGVEENPN